MTLLELYKNFPSDVKNDICQEVQKMVKRDMENKRRQDQFREDLNVIIKIRGFIHRDMNQDDSLMLPSKHRKSVRQFCVAHGID